MSSIFPMPSRVLGAAAVLNQMRFVGNVVFGKLLSYLKIVFVILQKSFRFGFITKKDPLPASFCGVLLQRYS